MNQQAEPFLRDMKEARISSRLTSRRSTFRVPHESAHLHVSGRASYTDDIPVVAGTLHAALGMSAKAHAKIVSMSFDAVRATPGVVAVFTAADIPGVNDVGRSFTVTTRSSPMMSCNSSVSRCSLSSPMSHDIARRAARRAEVVYEELPAILTPQQARAANAHVLLQ